MLPAELVVIIGGPGGFGWLGSKDGTHIGSFWESSSWDMLGRGGQFITLLMDLLLAFKDINGNVGPHIGLDGLVPRAFSISNMYALVQRRLSAVGSLQ